MDKSHKNMLMAFLLNLLFSIIELIGGFFTNSISIISDSIHDLGDAASIGIATILEKKSMKEPDKKYTFGYLRYSLLGALFTSIILLIGSIIIIYNVIPRLINPIQVNYDGMIILAIVGLVINGIAALKTSHSHNLNEKSVSLHMFEDVLGWAAVLVGSFIIKLTGWYIIDPILSILITFYILTHVYKNIKEIFNIFLEKMPESIDIDELKKELNKIENVEDIHHIHIWTMDNMHNYITLHAKINKDVGNEIMEDTKNKIRETLKHYNLEHSTIEIEYEKCKNEKCEVKNCSSCHHHHHH